MPKVGGKTRDMRGEKRPPQVERAIAQLSTRQYGVAGRAQLVALGLGDDAIDWRLAQGRLHRIHRGVYSVGHRGLTRRGRWAAALLASGAGAVLSHLDAAAVWDLARCHGPVNVTTDVRTRRGHPGITLHRVRSLPAEDRARRDGFPVTSVARTLLDLAGVVDRHRLARLVEQAERLQLFDLTAVNALLERSNGRRGCRALRAVLEDFLITAPETRSELERRFLQLCRDAGLPLPHVNVIVEGFEVDMAWPAQRLVVELDSFGFHKTRAAFERDRTRDMTLKLAGWDPIRVTDRRLRREPHVVEKTIRALLAKGNARAGTVT
jgi:very-short-patch-repair endonuclease